MLVRDITGKILGELPTPNYTRPGFKHTFVATTGKFIELEVAEYWDAMSRRGTLCFKSDNHAIETIGDFHGAT